MSRMQVISSRSRSCRVLIKEIKKKDPSKIRKLLAGGANVNGTDSEGDTPLHHALASRSLEIVRLLVEHGADVNADNECGLRPYQVALNDNFFEALEFLLQHGAVVSEVNASVRRLPSHLADLFYDKVDLDARNVAGHTALHVLTCMNEVRAIRRLLSRGADASVESSYRTETPLHLVNSGEVAELLLDHGARIDAYNRYAVTPLCEVAMRSERQMPRTEQTRIVELLVERGAEILDVLVIAQLNLDYNGSLDAMDGVKDVLKFAGLRGDENAFAGKITRDEFDRFYAQVRAEVKMMEQITFYRNVSFYEFLAKSWRRRANHIDDLGVVRADEKIVDAVAARFPLYCEILRRHIDAARERDELRNNAAMAIGVVCPRLRTVDLVIGKVLSHLTRKDMRFVVDAVL